MSRCCCYKKQDERGTGMIARYTGQIFHIRTITADILAGQRSRKKDVR